MMFVEDSVDLVLRMIHAIYHRYLIALILHGETKLIYIKFRSNEGMIQGL